MDYPVFSVQLIHRFHLVNHHKPKSQKLLYAIGLLALSRPVPNLANGLYADLVQVQRLPIQKVSP